MIKKILLLVIACLTLSLGLAYAQTSPLQIAQNQVQGSTEFANQELTARNANRYAALQNQVGTTISVHKRIVDESKRNIDQVLTKLDLATNQYSSFNARFLH